ncbi:hypothetical protein BpHYR1_019352 [Brachionus plicatilis]|uniref:Uncharacterized protein n=1 Tax=Brachionus plicatilis TaxID=10195 RepID=A0A3M7QNH5_BRAPC|nr:hypothetical protein BpHYR1_019352 [Brachionus plicatilis]
MFSSIDSFESSVSVSSPSDPFTLGSLLTTFRVFRKELLENLVPYLSTPYRSLSSMMYEGISSLNPG